MRRLALFGTFLMCAVLAAVALPGRPAEAQSQCYQETGFCIENPAFQEYFRVRGGTRILGYPVSRTFMLEGNQVQFFQRVVLQQSGNSVNRLNVLDPDVMPMTRANGSTFPAPDTSLGGPGAIPDPSSPDYADRVIDFVEKYSPNQWNGRNVGFFDLFKGTVPVDVAFPGQTPNPGLVTLLNMEIWGVPTSQPTPDPANGGFTYQRFQRGIMHYRAEQNVTEGILVADYLKSVVTMRNLPPDLAEEMRGSRYFNQYDPSAPNWVRRPAELPNTNLTNAFEAGSGGTVVPPAAAPTTAAPAATATTTGPAVSIQLDDDLVDPGDTVSITVIARDARGLEWIAWEGDDTDDEELDREHRFDCNGQTECATVWTVTVTEPGRHTLNARAQTVDDVTSELAPVTLRVREASATPAPTTAPTVAPTTVPTMVPTAVPTSGTGAVPKP